jgi:hypothetical protein
MSTFIPFGIGRYRMEGDPGSAIPVWTPEKPLSDEFIKALHMRVFAETAGDRINTPLHFARALEVAHGITP